jgi:hypothetical protein
MEREQNVADFVLPRSAVVRTPDGVRYQIMSEDTGYARSSAGRGELLRIEDEIGDVVHQLSRSIVRGIRQTGASSAKV